MPLITSFDDFYYVYVLMCNDNKPYTGCTSGLEQRIIRHNLGYVPATIKRLPVRLMCYFAFKDKHKAFRFEKYLKTGSGRAFLKKHLL